MPRPAATADENTWGLYLADQSKVHADDIGMRPYIYVSPAGEGSMAEDRRKNETDSGAAADAVIATALATYLRQIRLTPPRYERFIRGETAALDEREKLGRAFFLGRGSVPPAMYSRARNSPTMGSIGQVSAWTISPHAFPS